MKRSLSAWVAVMLIASSATAIVIRLDTDARTYQIGDPITITAILEAAGDEFAFNLASASLSLSWDMDVASVANGPPGFATQLITAGPGVGTSALTTSGAPFTAGAAVCMPHSCSILEQYWFGPASVVVKLDAQTLVGTLILSANAEGMLWLSTNIIGPGPEPFPIHRGQNFLIAEIVPEPSTGLLVGVGLLVLGRTGCRRVLSKT